MQDQPDPRLLSQLDLLLNLEALNCEADWDLIESLAPELSAAVIAKPKAPKAEAKPTAKSPPAGGSP